MVTHPGTAVRARAGGHAAGLHPLNGPRPVQVAGVGPEDGTPRALLLDGRRLAVLETLDTWLVEDEWWRTPVARRYQRLLLDGGRTVTLFHDLAGGGWYLQPYHGPRPARAALAPA